MKKSWIANGVTALNGLLGGLSIMLSFNGEFNLAAICILLAVVADAADGRTARALGTSSPLGVELDSLCDDISFGISMAEEVLGLVLSEYMERGIELPKATPIKNVKTKNDEFVTLIKIDLEMRKYLQ
mgnify:FL=1